MVHTTVTVQYSTVLSGNIWQELELEPKLEPKLWTKVEPEPKINNFGSATLQIKTKTIFQLLLNLNHYCLVSLVF